MHSKLIKVVIKLTVLYIKMIVLVFLLYYHILKWNQVVFLKWLAHNLEKEFYLAGTYLVYLDFPLELSFLYILISLNIYENTFKHGDLKVNLTSNWKSHLLRLAIQHSTHMT